MPLRWGYDRVQVWRDDSLGGDEEDEELKPATTPVDTGDETEHNTTEQRDDSLEEETPSASSALPWLYERDSITDGRSKTVPLHLQDTTLEQQCDARADVETQLCESIKKADLREAALLVGLEQLNEVAAQLRKWSYDIE